ncbi:putative DNA-binding WGR domain protein [Altererythrobacter atlanticus]|uniref:WGR domain protein n=1 Tax=Croceibacterium atlanticum TaxID=1267766 RepID=A0A0F7KVF1_9SPHN|nr:WGR domain-containing protein [Croceibacterium atlanticum]AKH44313.1 WGR domain protein [Croceibacterium atlanticum]MBB5733904.1 putative DNA-binding WGR domain protein [Croceibacterium atlanticum]
MIPLPPDVPPGFAVHLRAVDPARNVARRYEIVATAGLFGEIIVQVDWGRIGTRGQSRRLSFPSEGEAGDYVRTLLRRRNTAHRRIGVAYREVTGSCPVRPGGRGRDSGLRRHIR